MYVLRLLRKMKRRKALFEIGTSHVPPNKSWNSVLFSAEHALQLFRPKPVPQPHIDLKTAISYSEGNSLITVSGRITVDTAPDFRLLLLDRLQDTECKR